MSKTITIHRGINKQRRAFFYINEIKNEDGSLKNFDSRNTGSRREMLKTLLQEKLSDYKGKVYFYVNMDTWGNEVSIHYGDLCFKIKLEGMPEFHSTRQEFKEFVDKVCGGFEEWFKTLPCSETFNI